MNQNITHAVEKVAPETAALNHSVLLRSSGDWALATTITGSFAPITDLFDGGSISQKQTFIFTNRAVRL